MLALGLSASVIGVAICLLIDWFPVDASGSADQVDTVYDVLLICLGAGLRARDDDRHLLRLRFQAKPGDMRDGPPIHGNTRLEVIWVTIPFLMVTALAIYGWVVLDDIEAKQADEMVVNVTGRQFTWTFEYPQEKVNSTTLVLPEGPAGRVPDPHRGRDPLLLGAGVPAQVGRRARPRPPRSA